MVLLSTTVEWVGKGEPITVPEQSSLRSKEEAWQCSAPLWTEEVKETHSRLSTFCPWSRGGSMALLSAMMD